MKNITCPRCGKEMLADLHDVEDFPGKTLEEVRTLDNWYCGFCFVVLDRTDFLK